MKIRSGFVSNSSSSSFCIYGCHLTHKKFADLASCLGNDLSEEDVDEASENDDLDELVDEVNNGLKAQGFTSYVIQDGSDYSLYLARYFNSLKDDETYGQMKRSVNDVIDKFLPGLKASYQEEGWYS